MLVVALGVALTAILLAKVAHWHATNASDLGSMSHQWVRTFQATEPVSSL